MPPAGLVAAARHPARYGRRRFACRSGRSAASAPAAASQAPCGPDAHAAFSHPQCGSRAASRRPAATRLATGSQPRRCFAAIPGPAPAAARRCGLIIMSARAAAVERGACRQAPGVRAHPARYGHRRFFPQRHHGGRRAVRHPHCASLFVGSRRARRLSAIPKKRSGCGQSGLGFFVSEKARPHRSAPRSVERPARPFGDGHRLFAPLKTPVIKAGTVHRRYRRLMPLPVPGAAPLHPVTPTLRLLATGGYALCHARCPPRGCKAGSRSSVPPDRPLP